jgi:6-pyruvoyltetrahydropterin/6-carboxytetrahydropterin synthase
LYSSALNTYPPAYTAIGASLLWYNWVVGGEGLFEISVEETFDAAHCLRGYSGNCSNLHGHTYRVAVIFRVAEVDDNGISLDFRKAKAALRALLANFDHKYLNDLPEFAETNPTAENLARTVFRSIRPQMPELHSVRVWETPSSSVSYTEDA